MTADLELHTISAYGYRLGGPGRWQLPGLPPAGQLRTAWYDETNPTHRFVERASMHVQARLGLATPELSELPWTFATAAEVSADDWTPESSAPAPLSLQLPADSQLRDVDRAVAEQYVLVISESQVDRDEQELSYYDDDDDDDLAGFADPQAGAPTAEWDRTLMDALTMLGFEPDGLPRWLWYRQLTRL
jgi:hypothetical protein